MPIRVSNIRFVQKTGKGHLLETPINSQHISQLESDIMRMIDHEGYTANSTVTRRGMVIKNIKVKGTQRRAPGLVYSRLREIIATGLEHRNMHAEVTGGRG